MLCYHGDSTGTHKHKPRQITKKKKKPNVFHVSEIWTVTKVTGLCPKMEKTKDQGRVMEALNNTHAHTR